MFTTAAQLLDLTDSEIPSSQNRSIALRATVIVYMADLGGHDLAIYREANAGSTRWQEAHWCIAKLGSIWYGRLWNRVLEVIVTC